MLETVADPYEAIQGETDKAFAAFCVYRDLDPAARTLTAVRGTKGAGKVQATRTVKEWSKSHDWAARAAVWDAAAAQRHSDRLAAYRATQDDRHLKVLDSQSKQLEVVIERNRKQLKGSTASTMTAAEASKMHTEVIKAQRLVLGEATEITATQEAPPRDFSVFTPEERLAYAKLQDKLTKG